MALPYAEVIGDPVEHSRSPLIHGHWLEVLGIAGDYRRTRVGPSVLASFLDERRSDPDWRGCNVTAPHKQAIIAWLDVVDAQAAAVGAVNCVVPSADGLMGYNTDVDGVAAALDGLALSGATVTLVGAGGAARAAATYLGRRGIARLNVLVRDPARAESLRELLPAARMEAAPFDHAGDLVRDAALIVNASPVGMSGFPEMPSSVLDAIAATAPLTGFDMVYEPLQTAFLGACSGRRIDGLAMLVGQAARAFTLFFGAAPPPPDGALFDRLTA